MATAFVSVPGEASLVSVSFDFRGDTDITFVPSLEDTANVSFCENRQPHLWTVADLRGRLAEQLALPTDDFRLQTRGGAALEDSDGLFPSFVPSLPTEADRECDYVLDITSSSPVAFFNLLLRLRGGKGGFGANLRSQGGRMSSQKTSNNEACRDLQGRRLKTLNDAKKLAAFRSAEADRAKQRELDRDRRIAEGLREPERRKHRFDDTEYIKDHEKVVEDTKEAVEKVMKLMKSKDKEKEKAKAAAKAKSGTSSAPKKVIKGWDEDEDSDNGSEAESEGAGSGSHSDSGEGSQNGSGERATEAQADGKAGGSAGASE